MRTLKRNEVPFYYASYLSKEMTLDEYGNMSGQYGIHYSNPQIAKGNISVAKGEVQREQFGEKEDYDKVIILDKAYEKLDEYSVLWIDTDVELKDDGSTDTPYDYVVIKVAKSLNTVSLAIRKVLVS